MHECIQDNDKQRNLSTVSEPSKMKQPVSGDSFSRAHRVE